MKTSSCTLDPIPTALLKACTSALSLLITHSLQSGSVPPAFKTSVISPLLKKPTLDPEILANYRSISIPPFLSKVLEKGVAVQLQDYLKQNNLFEKLQSGFRQAHSTEMALFRVTNDLLMAADVGCLLILLERLWDTIGLSGAALSWFHSYLSDRTEYVSLGGSRSRTHHVPCGVPQRSVLGPILFVLYMLPLGRVISRCGISFHCYANDSQLYVETAPGPSDACARLNACL
uniref:Reverse transcriptase domain-containing protein n=1 Tax=Oncorhynchus kisutch TaxID=8019 RepID=A0A8C7D7L2_ONCKI